MTAEEIGNAIVDLKIQIGAYRAEVTAQNVVTNAKLQSIDDHLNKVNGRVGKVEALQAERQTVIDEFHAFKENSNLQHIANCPNVEKIRKLEDENLSNKSVKKFMGIMFTSGIALGGLIVAVLKLILG